jgi:hypothetical protein
MLDLSPAGLELRALALTQAAVVLVIYNLVAASRDIITLLPAKVLSAPASKIAKHDSECRQVPITQSTLTPSAPPYQHPLF